MHLISRNLWNIEIVLIVVSNPVLQVAWEEEVDTVWRTTEAGMEEEDKEVTQVYFGPFENWSWTLDPHYPKCPLPILDSCVNRCVSTMPITAT